MGDENKDAIVKSGNQNGHTYNRFQALWQSAPMDL